ncbi:hypothetical protein, partial [Escherichia coli]
IGQVENMSVEGLFVHGGDLWRLNTPLSCLQPPQQGKTLLYTVVLFANLINRGFNYQSGTQRGGKPVTFEPLILVSLSDYVVYMPALNYLFSKPATAKWI